MNLIFTALRIGLAVAVINGAARTAMAYWTFYELKDHAQQTAIFGGRMTPDVLRNTVLAKAGELHIPVTEEQVDVRRESHKTIIAASYEQSVEYFPRRTWPVTFSFQVEGFTIEGAGPVH
jgi:hypothetical protein